MCYFLIVSTLTLMGHDLSIAPSLDLYKDAATCAPHRRAVQKKMLEAGTELKAECKCLKVVIK